MTDKQQIQTEEDIKQGLQEQEKRFNQLAKEIICLFDLPEYKNHYKKKLEFLIYEFNLRFISKDFLNKLGNQKDLG